METLIKLYAERALENIFSCDLFRPKQLVWLCPPELIKEERQKKLALFFASRGYYPKIRLVPCSRFNVNEIISQLESVCHTYSDCAIDLTGGSNTALFACGVLAERLCIPAFTYSRKLNCFFNIRGAEFADAFPCSLHYSVAEYFPAAGGRMREGRVDNAILADYLPLFDRFFDVFLRHQSKWNDAVVWMQRQTGNPEEEQICAPVTFRVRGSQVSLDPSLAYDLERIGMLKALTFSEDGQVSFQFADKQIRAWLRDVGSVLELYIYKACLDTGIFNDVVSSAVVDWDEENGHICVTNEIDAVASRGVTPLFISCKACDIKTEALNELAILRDRFGGKGAKAAIVTTEVCGAPARHRAAQLDIAVIDAEELSRDRLLHRLRVIMKAEADE